MAIVGGALLLTQSLAVVAAGEPVSQPGLTESLRGGDLAGAFRQTQELAEANDIESQHNLSLFFWHGVGAPQNFDEAMRWSTMAAIRGHKKADAARKAMLGSIDPKVVQDAMKWARLRLTADAEKGDDGALLPLSNSYTKTFGAADEALAYYWAALAVSTGNADARRQRDAIASTITQTDLIKTQQRANEWFKRWRKAQS